MKMLVDIDPDLLEQAREVFGVGTKRATVHEALRAAVEQHARREALAREIGRAALYQAAIENEGDAWA